MDTFIVFCLVFQVTEAFNKLLVFRESSSDHWTLVCAAKDNGDALTWNTDSNWKENSTFKSTYTKKNNNYDCEEPYDRCMWHTEEWKKTNPKQNPMGPVFDSKWENFKEYNNFGNFDEYEYIDTLPRKGALAFSIRGMTDTYIVLCQTKFYESSFCYRIIIGGQPNMQVCLYGVHKCTPSEKLSCLPKEVNYINEEQFTLTEWRHYILIWDDDKRNIILYNDKKPLLTCTYTDYLYNSEEFNLFHKLSNLIYIRYHIYDYFYTKQKHDVLESYRFEGQNNNVCLRLSIGLCTKCSVNISLVTTAGYEYKEAFRTVSGTAAIHGLPTWKYVMLNMTVSNFTAGNRVSIRITTITKDETDVESFWAVRNIIKCPPPATMKIGRITYDVDYNILPYVACERISYTRSEIVKAHVNAVALETDDYDCPNGALCSMSCKSFYQKFNENCQNIAICDAKGCTCHTGLTGDMCNRQCDNNKYGYMCKKTCGRCQNQPCDCKTGLCKNEMCDNRDVHYIPPYCDIGIHNPPPPILSFNETSVHAEVTAQDNYKKTKIEYTFVLTTDKSTTPIYVHPYQIIFQNTTKLEVTIGKLKPGTFYLISCNLRITKENSFIYGLQQKFKTSCSFFIDFTIVTGAQNLTITANIQKTVLYPCPFDSYNVKIKKNNTQMIICEKRLTKMPFIFNELEPDTIYKVIISDEENTNSMSLTAHTKDGISSPVENIYCTISNNNTVYLQWNQPKKPNGKIKEYEIILNITTYYGCFDLKRDTRPSECVRTRTNTTNITFYDLQPYIMYTAIIYAWNSNRGEAAFVNFSTNPTKTPRSSYINLRKEENKLVWDPPKDCTIISGPITATKLNFTGVSKAIKNYKYVIKTVCGNSFSITEPELYGKERYKVFVYPLRGPHEMHNSSTYIDLEFDTPAKAPPRVRNLEIVEVDTSKNSILLRWLEPFPPNGKIDHYNVANCFSKTCIFYVENVPKNKHCPLWDNYICTTIYQNLKENFNITVYAINENVNANGEYAYTNYYSSEIVSDQSENLTARVYPNKIVSLSWLHPWRTRLRLKKFFIQTNIIGTKLRHQIYGKIHKNYTYLIKKYERKYTMVLDLIPSTQYEFFVYPVSINEIYGKSSNVSFKTPAAIDFGGHLSYRFQSETVVCLQIPIIINDTTNSKIYFIVKGENPCKEHVKLNQFLRRHVTVKSNEFAWLATSSPANDYSGNEFCVGDNTTHAANCPLIAKDFYTVIVIVQADENSTDDEVIITSVQFGDISNKRHEVWAVPIVIILIVSVLTYYFYRRRMQKMPPNMYMDKNVSIYYNTKKIAPMTPNLSENNRSLRSSTTDIISLSIEAISNDNDPPTPIKLKDLEDYVKNAIKSGLLDKQYEMFPRGLTKPCNYGKLPENTSKNRYKNLVAYDETRVVLKKLQDNPFSDYINANYIKGYKMEKRYIATQGPKPNTIGDFWRMVWQENVLAICMLTNVFENGKIKCEQYWPDVGTEKKYGDVKVSNVKHDVFADYTFRILHVTYDGETRQVKHLHYTTWPDHGVPTYTHSVVTYLKELLATQVGNGPVVVHCSAGVGRTGTIILCDICLRRAAAEGVIDVFSETKSIRNQRVNMVDNKQQYLFAHLILVECLLAPSTSIPCDQNLSAKINEIKKQLHAQFQRLEDTTWQDEALRKTISQTSLSKCNIAKHRYPELVSKKAGRIYLKKYPLHVEDSDYIAAVHVDGLKVRNQYLASQLPLPSTFSDFWRMVAEFKVELIVVLQPPDPNDSTCCPIVPTNDKFKPTPYISVSTTKVINDEYYVLHKLKLIDDSEKFELEQSITILSSTKFEAGQNKDLPPVDALIKLWQATERLARGDSPIVVLCHDGVTGCGLYLALSFLLERMAIERECDVCLAIRTVRRSRSDFIRSIEQMEYLYDAVLTYAEYFKTYANFS